MSEGKALTAVCKNTCLVLRGQVGGMERSALVRGDMHVEAKYLCHRCPADNSGGTMQR